MGSTTAADDQSTSPPTTSNVVEDLIQPIVDLGAPLTDGSPNTTAGPAAGNTSSTPTSVLGAPTTKPDVASRGSVSQPNEAGSGRQLGGGTNAGSANSSTTNTASAPIGGGGAGEEDGVTMLSACTVTNSYTYPGVLGLLTPQFQSGPIQTMSCVPAAVGSGEGVTMLSACTVTNSYTNPGAFGLLAAQYQSGPVQTMSCAPAPVAGGGHAVVYECTVTNSYSNPGALGLLSAQYQSGPVQTVSCVPAAAVVAHDASGSRGSVDIGGPLNEPSESGTINKAATSPGNSSDGSTASRTNPASVTGRSALSRTGSDVLALRNAAGLLTGLGLLAMRVRRSPRTGSLTSRD